MIDLPTTVRFLMQLGLAVCGAASLWSIFLHYRKKRTRGNEQESLRRLIGLLMFPFSLGLALFTLSWILLKEFFYISLAHAHEGIAVGSNLDYIQNGLQLTSPFVYLLIFVGAVLIYLFHYRKDLFDRYGVFLFGGSFLLISLIHLFILHVGLFNEVQLFYFLHHWHSIFTLGTVLVVDFLYVRTIKNMDLKRAIYPLFPFLSVAIWVGLGIDFLSNLLIFEQAFNVNSQFLFIQTVIAIIILNGAMLSGKINDRLSAVIRPENPRPLSLKEESLFGLSGSVSIVSWLTISSVDLFAFEAGYWEFLGYYLLVILVAFCAHHFVGKRLGI